ncbi:MAG: hypothetical protein V8Q23_10875 [Eubacteriales bacterium]
MYNKLCDTLIANGMWDSVPGYLKDYAPHFTVDKPDTKLARVLYKFGIKPDSTLDLRLRSPALQTTATRVRSGSATCCTETVN